MFYVSYSDGKFGFINADGYVYITDDVGRPFKRVYVGDGYTKALTMTPSGFVACDTKCAFFDFEGNKLWDVDIGKAVNGPSYYKDYWYVADSEQNKLLIIKDGKVVNEISYDEKVLDTAVCGNYLAVTTTSRLYLYDLSNSENPKEVWNVGKFGNAYQVDFGFNCEYIAVADTANKEFKVYNLKKELECERKFKAHITSIDCWKNKLAVGTEKGEIYVFVLVETD